MSKRTVAERNLDAEVRGVEEGHRAWLLHGDAAVKVVSDTEPGKFYEVTAWAAPSGPIMFRCVPHGGRCEGGRWNDHGDLRSDPGVLGCKHAGVAARRLEREGLARLDPDGRWMSTIDEAPERPADYDPFKGL